MIKADVMKRQFHKWAHLQLALIMLLEPLDSYAYIDPNTGGWLFQLIFPIIVAIGIGWNFFRNRMRAVLDWIRSLTKQQK